jgi:hypothetical protein
MIEDPRKPPGQQRTARRKLDTRPPVVLPSEVPMGSAFFFHELAWGLRPLFRWGLRLFSRTGLKLTPYRECTVGPLFFTNWPGAYALPGESNLHKLGFNELA